MVVVLEDGREAVGRLEAANRGDLLYRQVGACQQLLPAGQLVAGEEVAPVQAAHGADHTVQVGGLEPHPRGHDLERPRGILRQQLQQAVEHDAARRRRLGGGAFPARPAGLVRHQFLFQWRYADRFRCYDLPFLAHIHPFYERISVLFLKKAIISLFFFHKWMFIRSFF